MFVIVKTPKQQKEFENTWEFFCKKYRWRNDPYAENGIRYNLTLPSANRIFKRKKTIGTIEFTPYDASNHNSTVEGRFKFSKFEDIILQQNRVWEIDKLCIHEDYQRKGYAQNFIHIFLDHAIKNNPKYYLALIEKKLYRMLRISFGLHVEQRGSELVGPKTTLIPMVFDMESFMEDQNKIKAIQAQTYTAQQKKTHSDIQNQKQIIKPL